jgi:hypothetical protein
MMEFVGYEFLQESNFHVTRFSRVKDDIFQWQRYGGNEGSRDGVSIGFKHKGINQEQANMMLFGVGGSIPALSVQCRSHVLPAGTTGRIHCDLCLADSGAIRPLGTRGPVVS